MEATPPVLLTCEEKAELSQYLDKPHIPGILGNFLVYTHGKELWGDEEEEPPSEKNEGLEIFETDVLVGLLKHLCGNWIPANKVGIMCNDIERIHRMQMKLVSTVAGSRVSFRHPDNCLDESKKQVFLVNLTDTESPNDEIDYVNAIFKAATRSSLGIIVVASFRLFLEAKEPRWKSLIDEMYRNGYMHPYIRIHCQIHDVSFLYIQTAKELEDTAPFGGCNLICQTKDCGHFSGASVCRILPRRNEEAELCKKNCNMKCPNDHKCIKYCHEACRCERGCPFLRPCGHTQNDKKACRAKCLFELSCGHKCKKSCSECTRGHDSQLCEMPCKKVCDKNHKCPPHPCNTPCPPCKQSLEVMTLPCGHKILNSCSSGAKESTPYLCQEACTRRFGVCNHTCPKKCYEDCGVCENVTMRPHPMCEHLVPTQCHMPILTECTSLVLSKDGSSCGHDVMVPCWNSSKIDKDQASTYCTEICNDLLKCGHHCLGTCKDCHQGRFHIGCTNPCGRILFCNHDCMTNCSAICPPCSNQCMNICEHHQCPFQCGVPCSFICSEPCPYLCPHLSCTKTCGEVCDREGCIEKCTKLLPCEHTCVGFCGEPCPPACRICSPERLTNILEKPTEFSQYIFLPACGHTIEESDLSSWISTEKEHGEIKLKACPMCLKPLEFTSRRYSKHVRDSFQQVLEVKRKIYGNEREMEDILSKVRRGLNWHLSNENHTIILFPEFSQLLMSESSKPLKIPNLSCLQFNSMYIDKAQFVAWAFAEWYRVETNIVKFQCWEEKHINKYANHFLFVADRISERDWPLHPNEMTSVNYELKRLSDMELIYSRFSLGLEEQLIQLARTRDASQRFEEADAVLGTWKPYTLDLQEKFRDIFEGFSAIQNYTLKISDEERTEIVKAFGSRAGRWFKCKNGHVYVVTECGGATEVGTCNECGENIGGENHQLLESNELASEMDGAQTPLYPTVLLR